MRLAVTRSGGLANLHLRGTLDTEELDPEEARELERVIAEPSTTAPHGARQGADRYQYDLTLGEGVNARSVSLDEDELSSGLRALLARILVPGRGPKRAKAEDI